MRQIQVDRLAPIRGVEPNVSLIDFVRASPDEVSLGKRFQRVIQSLGFSHYIYSQIDVSQPRLYMICSTYPDQIRRVWADASVAVRDPLVAYAVTKATPIRRSDIPDDGAWASDIFEGLQHFGIYSPAWHFPVRDQTNYMGLFAITPTKADYEALGRDHFEHAEMLLPALCTHAHEIWCQLTAGAGEDTPPLSEREIEILSWLSHGKSTEDIAEIMQIAERTVNYHVANLKTKLGVETRAHAVAQAMRLRLI